MSFIYPSFLFAFFAVGIPIIIHLFNLQRTKKVYFSNIAFLKDVQNVSKRSIKVKNLFILLSRILFIIFLVLAFAQPYIPSTDKVQLPDHLNIYVDNSLSNQINIGNDKVLDVSVKNVEALAKVLPENTSVGLFSNDFANSSVQSIRPEKLPEVVTGIKFSPKSKALSTVLNRRENTFSNQNKEKALYIFSDFQKSFIKEPADLRIDTTQKIKLFPVTPESTSNVFIDSVWLENPFTRINENNIIKARVVNSGNSAKDNILIKLSIEGRQAATSTVSMKADSKEEVSFNFSISSHGIKSGTISLSDFPVTFDNDFYFSFRTAEKVRILEVINNKNTTLSYVRKVYSDPDIFQIDTRDIDNLDFNTLNRYDLLVMNNLVEINDGFAEALNKFLENNSSLVVIPSPELKQQSYNDFLAKYSLLINKIASDTVGAGYDLEQPDLANPLFAGIFESQKERMFMPRERSLISWNSRGKNHLFFKDGSAFLSEVNGGGGKIYLFASDLQSSSGFAFNALFVPVMYKIAFMSKSGSDKLSYNFNDNVIALPVQIEGKDKVLKLTKDKLELIPGQRILNSEVILEISEAELSPGHYQLKLNDSTISVLSFNYAPDESLMNFYSSDELSKLFEKYDNVEVVTSASKGDFIDEINEGRHGLPLWKICLIIALLFLFIEILLLRFYKVEGIQLS